jgi:hypothetical protein
MIDQSIAIGLARAAAAREGWSFVEPVAATFRRAWFGNGGRWEIHTNILVRGARARFIIDASDGRIIEKGYIPR